MIETESSVSSQAPLEAIAQIQLCFQLEALLLRKKSLSIGDSSALHAEKVSFCCSSSHLYLFLIFNV